MKYTPSFFFKNPHLQTIWPTLFRDVPVPSAQQLNFETLDGDEVLVDFYPAESNKLIVLSHGLEGSSRRSYILGMARTFSAAGWNVMAWNNRSCGGKLNRLPTFYHSGFTVDLKWILGTFAEQFEKVFLTGFSMGGNITLKALGELETAVPKNIIGSAALSVPCDLLGSSQRLEKGFNKVYTNYFLKKLRRKVTEKRRIYPREISAEMCGTFKTLRDFDNTVTSRLYGFDSAEAYYVAASSLPWIENIQVPTLILNAKDDPFLSESCFPIQAQKKNPNIRLEMPDFGGHVGFVSSSGMYFSETRTLQFAEECLKISSV